MIMLNVKHLDTINSQFIFSWYNYIFLTFSSLQLINEIFVHYYYYV